MTCFRPSRLATWETGAGIIVSPGHDPRKVSHAIQNPGRLITPPARPEVAFPARQPGAAHDPSHALLHQAARHAFERIRDDTDRTKKGSVRIAPKVPRNDSAVKASAHRAGHLDVTTAHRTPSYLALTVSCDYSTMNADRAIWSPLRRDRALWAPAPNEAARRSFSPTLSVTYCDAGNPT